MNGFFLFSGAKKTSVSRVKRPHDPSGAEERRKALRRPKVTASTLWLATHVASTLAMFGSKSSPTLDLLVQELQKKVWQKEKDIHQKEINNIGKVNITLSKTRPLTLVRSVSGHFETGRLAFCRTSTSVPMSNGFDQSFHLPLDKAHQAAAGLGSIIWIWDRLACHEHRRS